MGDGLDFCGSFAPSIEQLKDVVRVAAYHRKDFDLAVIRFNPHEHHQVQQSLMEPFDKEPIYNLGILECLPIEISLKILLLLDVETFFRFRQASRGTRRLTGASLEYHAIVKHAVGSLCAVLRAKLGRHVTVGHVYTSLSTKGCVQCGDFGGFFFLLSFTRCCFKCLQTASRFGTVSISAAKGRFGRSMQPWQSLIPILHTIPGTYSMKEAPRKRRVRLVAEQHLIDQQMRTQEEQDEFPTPAAPSAVGQTPHISRFMAATAMPWLDVEHCEIQYGISCKGCQIAIELDISADFEARDQVYSDDGFWEHFQSCTQAQELWKTSHGGTAPFEEPESTRRGGYMSERDSVDLHWGLQPAPSEQNLLRWQEAKLLIEICTPLLLKPSEL